MFEVAGFDELYRRVKPPSMLLHRLFPYQKSRQDRSAGSQGKRGNCRRCAGRCSKEVDKDSLVARCVLIEEYSNGLVIAQRLQDVPACTATLDRHVTAQSAIVRNQFIHLPI